jgi:hypothetical protein
MPPLVGNKLAQFFLNALFNAFNHCSFGARRMEPLLIRGE